MLSPTLLCRQGEVVLFEPYFSFLYDTFLKTKKQVAIFYVFCARMPIMKYEIKDINLANRGLVKIEWAKKDMPVLAGIAEDFKKTKPFKNLTIGACLHVTAETANLMII